MNKPWLLLLLIVVSNPIVADSDQALLSAMLDQAIIPAYERLDSRSASLLESSQIFCAAPSADAMRLVVEQHRATRLAWSQAEVYLMGPAEADLREFKINFWPTKKRKVKKLLLADQAVTNQRISSYSLGGRGLPAMEYLLHQPDPAGNTGVDLFTGKDGAQRCSYLTALSVDLHVSTSAIVKDWGPYREQMLLAGASSEFDSSHHALEATINTLIASVELIAVSKLGSPVGAKSKGTPNPYKVEAWRSGDSLALIQAGMDEFSDMSQVVLAPQLRAAGKAQAADALLNANKQANRALRAISSSLFTAVTAEQAKVQAAEQAVRAVVRVLKNELAQALDVRLGFNDNDGD